MAQVESEVKQKLAFVKQQESNRLMAMADYIYATCKLIAAEKDRDQKCENFILDTYYNALEINGDN